MRNNIPFGFAGGLPLTLSGTVNNGQVKLFLTFLVP